MTYVDSADLERRTCPDCGAVIGDMLSHFRWHRDQDAAYDAITAVLEYLTPDVPL